MDQTNQSGQPNQKLADVIAQSQTLIAAADEDLARTRALIAKLDAEEVERDAQDQKAHAAVDAEIKLIVADMDEAMVQRIKDVER